EDVAEEIAADDDIERVGPAHEMRGQDVDVILLDSHVGIVLGHGAHTLVPERHRVNDAVRLRGRSQLAAWPRAGKFEGVAQDAIDAAAREDALLHRQLVLGAGIEAAADLRIFALVVLAHDQEIDVAGPAAGERARYALEQTHGPQIDVLLEAPADRDQQAPEGDVVRNARPANRAEKNGVMSGDAVEPLLRHHATVPSVVLAAPVELVPEETDVEAAASGIEHAHALGHDLLADAVSGNHRQAKLLHPC